MTEKTRITYLKDHENATFIRFFKDNRTKINRSILFSPDNLVLILTLQLQPLALTRVGRAVIRRV